MIMITSTISLLTFSPDMNSGRNVSAPVSDISSGFATEAHKSINLVGQLEFRSSEWPQKVRLREYGWRAGGVAEVLADSMSHDMARHLSIPHFYCRSAELEVVVINFYVPTIFSSLFLPSGQNSANTILPRLLSPRHVRLS